MARLSLILLRAPGTTWPADRIAACRDGLEALGLEVDVVAVSDPSSSPIPGIDDPRVESTVAGSPGLSEAAIRGLRVASGSLLVVLDQAMGYTPGDVIAVARRLVVGDASMVVASRPRRWAGALTSRVLGTADPTSGLIGLTKAEARAADDSFAPVGSRFALELLARSGGRRVDVPVGTVADRPGGSSILGDIRQLKRLADDRLGNVSRLLQFCIVGASGMVVDLTFYAIFQWAFARTSLAEGVAPVVGGSLAMAAARVLAIAIALSWNFSLNRRLTFNDARRGRIGLQFFRYVLSNLLGIGVSLTLSLVLPNQFGFFRDHRLAAAVVGIVAATGISFSMARWFVFGQKPVPEERVTPIRRRRCDGLRLHTRARPAGPLKPASTGSRAAIGD